MFCLTHAVVSLVYMFVDDLWSIVADTKMNIEVTNIVWLYVCFFDKLGGVDDAKIHYIQSWVTGQPSYRTIS